MNRDAMILIARVIREQVEDVESKLYPLNPKYTEDSLHRERDRLFNLTVCMANAIEEMQQTSSVPFPRNAFLSAAFSGDPDSLTT